MLNQIFDNLKDIITNPGVIVIGAITIIDISPIKIDPWKWLFKKIGNLLFGEIRKEITEIRDDLSEMKHEIELDKAIEKRWHILDFVNSCRNKRKHSREEWNHVISELAEYEDYCERKDITNGVIEEDAKYLRELFQELNRTNDFL